MIGHIYGSMNVIQNRLLLISDDNCLCEAVARYILKGLYFS